MPNENRPTTLAMFDLTIPSDTYTVDQIKEFMRTHCKRWCFQEEMGSETNYKHYQCRISLKSKKRLNNMISWIGTILPGTHVSASCLKTFTSNDEYYVMKEDTRINGPWTDRDDINLTLIPERLRSTPVWKPWQQTVLDFCDQKPNDRTINVIIDTIGNNGKSFLTLWMKARNMCQRIPQQKDSRDIMRMVMNLPKRKVYFIDLPRGTSHKDQNSVYAAIEEIKNGYCYDDRYHFKDELFEPPHVFIFTNETPNKNLLSKDRWVFWRILNDRLVPRNQEIVWNVPKPPSF